MTPIHVHEEARRERIRAKRRYARHDPRVAVRFDDAIREVFVRMKEAPNQFPEHALLAVPTATGPLFFAVRRARGAVGGSLRRGPDPAGPPA